MRLLLVQQKMMALPVLFKLVSVVNNPTSHVDEN